MLEILPEPIKFEWDKGNIDKSWKKHKVSSKKAEQVFFDRKAIIIYDEKHSKIEKRYLILGVTKTFIKLSIIFTKRKNKIRVISARKMNRKKKLYEETK